MTLLWLSQRLPVERPAFAAALGAGFELLPPTSLPPAGLDAATTMTVVTIYERDLIDEIGRRPDGPVIVVAAPPGTDLTGIHQLSPRLVAGIAVSASDIVNLVHQGARLAGAAPTAGWTAAGPDVIGAGTGTGFGEPGLPRAATTRRGQLASASVVLALLIGAAILVVATGGGSAGAATAGGGRGFGGAGGTGRFGGAAALGTLSTTQLAALRACLAEQGVSVGTGAPAGGAANPRTALAQCASALATPGSPGSGGSTGSTGSGGSTGTGTGGFGAGGRRFGGGAGTGTGSGTGGRRFSGGFGGGPMSSTAG